MISIIIPAFNAAAKIPACLESIGRQRFTNYEALVMDGQSSDITVALVDSYREKHLNIHLHSEPDAGIYDAMNKGIVVAKGQWLLFLGADDELGDDEVLGDIAIILKEKNPDIAYGDVALVGDTPFGKDGSIYGGIYDKLRLVKTNICHQAIFYKRSVFDEVGVYNLAYPVCADWDFNQRCFAILDTLYTPRVITKFSAGGLSSTVQDKFYQFDRVLNAKHYFKLSYFSNAFKDDFTIFRNISGNARNNGDYLKSVFFLIVAAYQGRTKLIGYLFRSRNTSLPKRSGKA